MKEIISQTEKEHIISNAAHIISLCDENMDVKEVLGRSYSEMMTDVSPFQARLLADEIVHQISEFQTWYDMLLREPEHGGFIFLHDLMRDMQLEQQCHTLHDIVQLAKLQCGMEIEDLPYSGEISEEERDRLMLCAEELLKKSLGTLPEPEDISLNETIDPDLFAALCSLVIYCMAKKGQLKNCPRNVSLRQIVSCVCRDMALQNVKAALDKEYLSKAEAENRRKALGMAAMLLLTAGCSGTALLLFSGKFALATAAVSAASETVRRLSGNIADNFVKMTKALGMRLVRIPFVLFRDVDTDVDIPQKKDIDKIDEGIIESIGEFEKTIIEESEDLEL